MPDTPYGRHLGDLLHFRILTVLKVLTGHRRDGPGHPQSHQAGETQKSFAGAQLVPNRLTRPNMNRHLLVGVSLRSDMNYR